MRRQVDHQVTIVLASTSQIRQKLLRAAGVKFSICAPGVDESAIKAQGQRDPDRLATRLAEAKAQAVSIGMKDALIVGADQVLSFRHVILDKPRDTGEAREHLQLLRGKTHMLHSAVACARDGIILWNCHDSARMTMRDFSDAFMDRYIAEVGDGLTSSVGGYKMEESGLQLFDKIEGSYFTILGLPLLPLLEFLRKQGGLER